MPRSPLIATATKELALYFQAITDATFIDRSWDVKTARSDGRIAAAAANATTGATTPTTAQQIEDPIAALQGNIALSRIGLENTTGTGEADHISNLINGATSIGEYFVANSNNAIPTEYRDQFKFYYRNNNNNSLAVMKEFIKLEDPIRTAPSIQIPNVYAVNVFNPFLGPMTRDTGPIEIFMNAIPTLEFSRCVPYINLEVITTHKEVGDTITSPSLSMIGFLNPASRGTADNAMLGAQVTQVASEASKLGPGIKSGIELFVMPQTLVNLGDTASEFTPVIDRLRPLASIDNFTLSTKLQGGTLSFTSGRIEITIFDRSRLREVAAFVRPDLYGTTFLDITHGWSHPDGGVLSKNSFGKFLNALKTETRYRVSNSSYAFEDGGKIKITLSVQSMGSIDLLYLGPSNSADKQKTLNQLVRALNQAIAGVSTGGLTQSMTPYDFLNTIKSPDDVLKTAADEDLLKKLKDSITSGTIKDADVINAITAIFGKINKSTTVVGGAAAALINQSIETYTQIINTLPVIDKTTVENANSTGGTVKGTAEDDPFAIEFIQDTSNRFKALDDNSVITSGSNGVGSSTFSNVRGDKSTGGLNPTEYVTYGSAFMKMVVDPLVSSKQYDEIQTIFYPFNSFAGAVHDLPISCFPIEKPRLNKAVTELSKKVPDISSQQMIALLQNKFTGYKASRAYLMTGFYDTVKTDNNEEVVAKDRKGINNQAVDAAATFADRLKRVGIPEEKFVMPKVEVAVEAAKLLDKNGEPVRDAMGNTKTLLKIHVYDASMDPHQTLTDIVSASNDSGLSIIAVPVANFNAAVNGNKNGPNQTNARDKYGVTKVIAAGLQSGLLQEIDIKTGLPTVANKENMTADEANAIAGKVADIGTGTYLRIKNDYAKVKELVSAGMPTLIYGSSMSAITNASLTTGGNAGLSNVLLQRAFAAPGEAAPDNVDSGVPMQITPASLSISTFGCPLFYPMQRFFIDFGTGTSIDSVYFVVSTETSIGSSGYKTDLKLSYSAGFATYVSLNQNLAMLSANFASATGADVAAATTESSSVTSQPEGDSNAARAAETLRIKAEHEVDQAAKDVVKAKAEFENAVTIAVNTELKKVENAVKAKIADLQAKVEAKAAKLIPSDVKIKAQEAQKKLDAAKAKVDAITAQAKKAQEIVAMAQSLLGLKDLVTPDYFVAALANAEAERKAAEEASKEATAAAKAEAAKKSSKK